MAKWSTFQIVIVVGMVVTGTLNTISAGYQQRAEGKGRDWASEEDGWKEGRVKEFNHPYLQAMGMMAGECLCMLAYFILTRLFKKGVPTAEDDAANVGFTPLILLPAALFDLIGTCLNYVGMILSYPSSFQMLRGSVIVFTAALSAIFLKRWPKKYQYLGIITIIGGLCIVGAGDMIFKEEKDDGCSTTTVAPTTTPSTTIASTAASTAASTVTTATALLFENVTLPALSATTTAEECIPSKIGSDPLTGDIIIVIGEVFHAFQFVWEDYFLSKYNLPPLKVVGFEGIFGFTTIGILLWPMYFIFVGDTFGLGPEFRFEDAIDGFTQLGNSGQILGWTFGNMLSIACFNFAGVTVTKELDATTRSVLDNIRQVFIWAFSLAVGWQKFNFLTPIGFVVLIAGLWLYNDIIIRPLFNKLMKKN